VGFAGAGKDVVARYLKELWESNEGPYKRMPQGPYSVTPRDALCQVGMAYRRCNPLYWVIKTMSRFDERAKEGPPGVVCFADIRFQNEADALKARGAELWRGTA
jgi:hypothetical protein